MYISEEHYKTSVSSYLVLLFWRTKGPNWSSEYSILDLSTLVGHRTIKPIRTVIKITILSREATAIIIIIIIMMRKVPLGL